MPLNAVPKRLRLTRPDIALVGEPTHVVRTKRTKQIPGSMIGAKSSQRKHVRSDEPEEALSDAIGEYRARITDEWRTPSLVEDARRKKRWQERDPQGRESGSGEEEIETSDADCYQKYTEDLTNAWRMGKK
jgi:hypothetical protein